MARRIDGKRLAIPVLALLIVLIVGTYWAADRVAPAAGGAAAVSPASPNRVSTVDGQTVVTVDAAAQAQSGIATAPVVLREHRAETTAYGAVLDLQPLLDLRARYVAAASDIEAARAAADASRQEFERSRALYSDDRNVSLKALQAAQAADLADQAKLRAATLNAQTIRELTVQQFGPVVGRWATELRSREFERLASRQESLLRIALPTDSDTASPPKVVEIGSADGRRVPATFVSPSPRTDPANAGTPFIYRTALPLSVGTVVIGHVATSDQTMRDAFVPRSAIVWYGGQPWAYVQSGADRFVRHPVPRQAPSEGGYYVPQGIRPGERVVVAGVQLLLSEETRPKAAGLACKDPECD